MLKVDIQSSWTIKFKASRLQGDYCGACEIKRDLTVGKPNEKGVEKDFVNFFKCESLLLLT